MEEEKVKNAINILAQAATQYRGTAQEHQTIQQAIKVIVEAVGQPVEGTKPIEEKAEEVKEKK